MAVRNIRGFQPVVWIPPNASAAYKVTVERSDGTIDDVSSIILSCKIENEATSGIGTFDADIPNGNEAYSGVWIGNEIFRYYCDYSDEATTLRFRGRIEKVSYQNNKVRINGRSEALQVMDVTVTKTYTDQETSIILKNLFASYGSQFTTTNVNTSTTNSTVSWVQKPFWSCVEELCDSAEFDCYIDENLDVHYFEVAGVDNDDEGIVHTYNLVEVGDFADDLSQVKNRIIVYGAEKDGIQPIYTAEDSTSQASYGVKEEVLQDDNITTETQAQEYAEYLLAKKKDPPVVGELKSILLASIQPGERIMTSSPENNLPPAKRRIVKFKHEPLKYMTTVSIEKEPRKITHFIKGMVEDTEDIKDKTINPAEMRFSYNFDFNENSGTHSSTEVTNGVLKPTAGSGTWTSDAKSVSSNISQAYLVVKGETLTGAAYEVSGDNGVHWEVIGVESLLALVTSIGKELKVRVTFSNADAQIDSLGVLFR